MIYGHQKQQWPKNRRKTKPPLKQGRKRKEPERKRERKEEENIDTPRKRNAETI